MSSWRDFVTNGLLGTERGTPLDLPDAIAATIDAPTLARQGREARFLTRAGAFAAWCRAGQRPAAHGEARTTNSGQPPAGPEEKNSAPLSPASNSHLRAMLGGNYATVLPEWLAEAARLQRLAPPELLPGLLDLARRRPKLRPLAHALGGRRAAWLAAQNPAWGFAAAADHPEGWETGSRDQRLALFRRWRAGEPALAREKLAAVWKNEDADLRAAFLEAMESDLSDEDVPFLEAALDDRHKDARRLAVTLLGFLPASPLVARMTKRADALLTFKKGSFLRRSALSVTLPDETDSTGIRDGLDSRAFGLQVKLGARAIILIQIVAAVPLSHWTEAHGLPPAALLKAVEKDKYAAAVATGWALAAVREGDAAWAEALLNAPVPPHAELLPRDPLMPLLPEATRLERLLPGIQASFLSGGRPSLPAEILAVRTAFPEGYLPERLTCDLLDALRRAATSGIPWHEREEIETLLAQVPPSLLPEAVKNWPTDRDGVAGFVDLLAFRHEAMKALSTL